MSVIYSLCDGLFFFFQAEDGIRDLTVTGVQTCALPIYIWVYSEPGQGATFKVYLPRVEPGGEPVAARPSPARALGGTETILLAEDEAAVRNLARRVLEKHGYKLLLAATGRDGVQLATQRSEE